MLKITKYVIYDIVRNRFVLAYTVLLAILSFSMFSLDSDPAKAMLSLLNLVLLAVPLVSIVFTTIHFFNSYEFMELLLAQPLARRVIFFGEYLGICVALCFSFLVGVGVPVLLLGNPAEGLALTLSGLLLTAVFVSLAFGAAVLTRDKAKGVGIALLFWIYFTLLYDGFVLYLFYSLSDYPLEKLTLALVTLNPVDLARIIILLKFDLSALMGYTGAFFKNFFGTAAGMTYSMVLLLAWAGIPLLLAFRRFRRMDI